jgi:hypothetical protein
MSSEYCSICGERESLCICPSNDMAKISMLAADMWRDFAEAYLDLADRWCAEHREAAMQRDALEAARDELEAALQEIVRRWTVYKSAGEDGSYLTYLVGAIQDAADVLRRQN